jgi:hypothetical protein
MEEQRACAPVCLTPKVSTCSTHLYNTIAAEVPYVPCMQVTPCQDQYTCNCDWIIARLTAYTSATACLGAPAGRPLAYASAKYPTKFPRPGWAEQDPADWWAALGAAVKQAVAQAGVSPSQVVGLSVDTTCCTVVALDEGEGRCCAGRMRGRGGGAKGEPVSSSKPWRMWQLRCRSTTCIAGS